MNFVIKDNLYQCKIVVCFGNKEDSLAYLKKVIPQKMYNYVKDDPFTSKGLCFDGAVRIIWMPNIPKTPRDFGTLYHEIFHCTGFIFDNVSVKYDIDNDEPFAYYIGWLTEQIYNKIHAHVAIK